MRSAEHAEAALSLLSGRWAVEERSGNLRRIGAALGLRGPGGAIVQVERGGVATEGDALIGPVWRRCRRWSIQAGGALMLERHEPRLGWVRLHTLILREEGGALTGEADDLCGSDLYAARLRFRPERLEFAWVVRGPAKRHEVRSLYAPADGCDRRALTVTSR